MESKRETRREKFYWRAYASKDKFIQKVLKITFAHLRITNNFGGYLYTPHPPELSIARCLADHPLDIDSFSEEFDLRMRFGRGPSSTCSTIPRPTFMGGGGSNSHHHQHHHQGRDQQGQLQHQQQQQQMLLQQRPGSAAQSHVPHNAHRSRLTRAGHLRYFWIFWIIKNDFLHFLSS